MKDSLRAQPKSGNDDANSSSGLLFDHNPLPMWVYDLETYRFLKVNHATVKQYGYSELEFMAMTLKDIRPPEEVERLLADLRHKRPALQDSGVWRHRRKDGSVLYVEIHSHTLDYDGRQAALVVAINITERKRAEAHLAYQAKLVASVSDAVVATDVNFIIQSWNKAAETLFGYTEAEVLGKPSRDAVAAEYINTTREAVLQTLRETGQWEGEIIVTNKQGGRRYVTAASSVIKDADGSVTGYLAINHDITERKQAEQDLRESEGRFRRLAENAPDLIYRYELTPKRGFTYVSPAATVITGYTPEEHYADPDLGFKLIHPDDRRRLEAAAHGATAPGQPLVLRWIRRDGSIIWTEQRNVPIFNEANEMIALEGIARDVTERRRAEQALLESEVRYRGIFDGVEEAIFVETPAGDILDMNQSACAMYGWTREEFLTKKVADLLPPEYVALRLDETGRGQLAERFVETVNRRANGEEFPVEISGRIHTLNGQSAILVVVRDITERKQAEIKEHKQLTALEAAANAIVITDQDGNIEWVNPAWSGLTGYAREEAIGKNPRILKSGRHPVEFYKSMWDTILAGKVWRGELVNQRKDGSRYDEEETITPVLDVHGEVRNFVAVKQDITGRKRAEAELQHLKEFNENIVQKMTEGIVVQDAVGQILFVNPAAAVLLGYPPEALVGQSWTHIVPADQHTIVRAADARRARGESDQYELDLVRADRTRLTVLVSAGPHRYNGHPVGVLVVFTDITARKQAEIDLLQRNRELNVLNRIGQALSRLLPLPELVELIYLTVGEVLDNRNLSLALYDESAHSLSFALYTIDGQRQTTPDRPLGHGLTEYILHTRAPLLITHDMSAALRERGITSIGHGAACYLGVPLLVGEKVLGVIALQDYEHEGAYTPHHVELLATIAAQAAIALENARLFAETHQRLEQLQALQTIDTAISGSLDLRLTLNVVLEQVMRQLGVHAAAVLLLEPQSLTLHYAAGRGFHSRAVEHTYVRLGQGLAGQAALERQTVHVPDLTDTGSYFYRAELRQAEGFVAYYAVPLVSKGRTLGVLEIFHRAPLNDDADWVNFLETLAGQTAIAVDNAQLFENLQRSNVELIAAYDNTLEGWSRALDLRDKETEGHSQRVTDLTLRLAQAIGMTADELVHVRRGALLHDIGKLGIPDAILLKPGKLTDDEWVIMRKHPTFAYELLLPITYLGPALAIPYGHHEKWDGTGYPRGLRGDAIPLAARIFAVVDVWDALRSDRPYRAAWPTEKVLEHIQAGSGTHFDPAVVQTFVRVMGQT